MSKVLALTKQLPLDIVNDYYSYTQFQDIILLLLNFKRIYPEHMDEFQNILNNCQAKMVNYVESHEDANSPSHFVFLGDQTELEKEYEEIVAPILEIIDRREPLTLNLSKNINLWGEDLYADYTEQEPEFQKRFFQYLNLDWAVEKIKNTSIKDLRLFTKTIDYYYIKQNISITQEEVAVINRFLPMLTPMAEVAEDSNKKKAFHELISLLKKLAS